MYDWTGLILSDALTPTRRRTPSLTRHSEGQTATEEKSFVIRDRTLEHTGAEQRRVEKNMPCCLILAGLCCVLLCWVLYGGLLGSHIIHTRLIALCSSIYLCLQMIFLCLGLSYHPQSIKRSYSCCQMIVLKLYREINNRNRIQKF